MHWGSRQGPQIWTAWVQIHRLAGWLWASYSASLILSFVTWRIQKIMKQPLEAAMMTERGDTSKVFGTSLAHCRRFLRVSMVVLVVANAPSRHSRGSPRHCCSGRWPSLPPSSVLWACSRLPGSPGGVCTRLSLCVRKWHSLSTSPGFLFGLFHMMTTVLIAGDPSSVPWQLQL